MVKNSQKRKRQKSYRISSLELGIEIDSWCRVIYHQALQLIEVFIFFLCRISCCLTFASRQTLRHQE